MYSNLVESNQLEAMRLEFVVFVLSHFFHVQYVMPTSGQLYTEYVKLCGSNATKYR
jgi:hypothetical protein